MKGRPVENKGTCLPAFSREVLELPEKKMRKKHAQTAHLLSAGSFRKSFQVSREPACAERECKLSLSIVPHFRAGGKEKTIYRCVLSFAGNKIVSFDVNRQHFFATPPWQDKCLPGGLNAPSRSASGILAPPNHLPNGF
ncbi:MAG: hypothetical protein IJQ73_08115 [Kiritimatiellae bacterium]|nr:hypothetical protein [Kiritimatiellia bacterium]